VHTCDRCIAAVHDIYIYISIYMEGLHLDCKLPVGGGLEWHSKGNVPPEAWPQGLGKSPTHGKSARPSDGMQCSK